jgi:uncharacterized protein YeaO (DUF488 family)
VPRFPIKRIYTAADPGDGARVLVDRLWPRGLRKQGTHIDLWLKEIAPSPALREWFGHDPANWQEFQRRYWLELGHDPLPVERLLDMRRSGPVTLLYAAHDTVHNHARALASYLENLSQSRDATRIATVPSRR